MPSSEKTIPQMGEYFQTMYHKRSLYPKYIKNAYNLKKKKVKNLKRHHSKEDIQIANKHVKRFPTPLAIREMQITTTVRYHYTTAMIPFFNKKKKDR